MAAISRLGPGGYPRGGPFGSFAGKPQFVALQLTDVSMQMLLPINCVVAGQQREPVSKLMGLDGAISGPLRGVFNE